MEQRPSWDLPIETAKTGLKRNIPRVDYELEGKSFLLQLDTGEKYLVQFLTGTSLVWGKYGESPCLYAYQAMRANASVWMVNFMEKESTCISLVLDTEQDLVTVLQARVGEYKDRPAMVTHRFIFGALQQPGKELPVKRHGFTGELAGKKIAWRYSETVTITHIYQTPFSIRSSLANMEPLPRDASPEQIAECENRAKRWGETFFEEPCRFVKIQKDLYLVAFIEENRNRVNAPEGGGDMAILVDTGRVHDVGRVFGAGKDGKAAFGLLTAAGRFVEDTDPMENVPSPYWI